MPQRELAFLEVFFNEEPTAKYGISTRNPAPLCLPIMMGVPMAMCVQMSDIAIKGNNLNMCMDFVVRVDSTELFEMHFQCMRMGLDGIQYVDKDGKPVIPGGNVKAEGDYEEDYYDETATDEMTVPDTGYTEANDYDNEIKIDEHDMHSIESEKNIMSTQLENASSEESEQDAENEVESSESLESNENNDEVPKPMTTMIMSIEEETTTKLNVSEEMEDEEGEEEVTMTNDIVNVMLTTNNTFDSQTEIIKSISSELETFSTFNEAQDEATTQSSTSDFLAMPNDVNVTRNEQTDEDFLAAEQMATVSAESNSSIVASTDPSWSLPLTAVEQLNKNQMSRESDMTEEMQGTSPEESPITFYRRLFGFI